MPIGIEKKKKRSAFDKTTPGSYQPPIYRAIPEGAEAPPEMMDARALWHLGAPDYDEGMDFTSPTEKAIHDIGIRARAAQPESGLAPWSNASPAAQEFYALAAKPWGAPPSLEERQQQMGIQAAPGRVPLQLGVEQAAAIDAEAGLRPPMAMRDPLNPRAGGLPIGVMRSAPPMPSEEEMQAAQMGVAGLQLQTVGEEGRGFLNFPDYGPTTDRPAQLGRSDRLRNDPKYKQTIEAARRVVDLRSRGAISQEDVQSPDSPYYVPPIHVEHYDTRTDDERSAMADKNAAYKQRLADDEAYRRSNLQQKIANRGLTPQQIMQRDMLNQLRGGGEMDPMMIGIATGSSQAAQLARLMQQDKATNARLAGQDSIDQMNKDRDFGLNKERVAIDRLQAENAGAANTAKVEQERGTQFRSAYNQAKSMGLSDTDALAEAQSQTGMAPPPDFVLPPTPALGNGAPTQTQPPAQVGTGSIGVMTTDPKMLIADIDAATTPDTFFQKYPPSILKSKPEYLPRIRQKFGDAVLDEYLADMPVFSSDAASQRNELSGMFGKPQVSRPWLSSPAFGLNEPSNYRPEQDPWSFTSILNMLLGK